MLCLETVEPDTLALLSLMLALRSLLYFDDAETEPMPRMLKPFDWDAAKAKMIAEVRNVLNNPKFPIANI